MDSAATLAAQLASAEGLDKHVLMAKAQLKAGDVKFQGKKKLRPTPSSGW